MSIHSISTQSKAIQLHHSADCDHEPITRIVAHYKRHMLYHGTDKKYLDKIYKYGLDISKKEKGCDHLLEKKMGYGDKNASKYNYVMGRDSAARYAKMHEKPCILRMIIDPKIHLEKDPEGFAEDEMRTCATIKPYCILPKHTKDLSSSQLDYINKLFGFSQPLCKRHLKKLKKAIGKELLKERKTDKKVIEKSVDFLTMERTRNSITLNAIQKSGIDLKDLKEGQELTICLD